MRSHFERVNKFAISPIITFYLHKFHPTTFNKMSHTHHNHSLGIRSEKQPSKALHKRIAAKGLRLVDEKWKYVSTIARSPSAIIGTSPKEDFLRSRLNVPGPGYYEFQRPMVGLNYNQKQENQSGFKLTRFHTDNPTTLSSHIDKMQHPFKKSSVSFSVNEGKNFTSSVKDHFMPDMHQGITFPKETRENLEKISNRDKSQSPGPGKYKEIHGKSSKNIFTFPKAKKFGDEEKQLSEKGSIPAPGKYELSQSRKLLRGPKFTQAARMITEPNFTPGPGSHSALRESSLSHQGGTIDRQKKGSLYSKNSPGPGSYEKIDINKIKKKGAVAVIGRSSTESTKANNIKIGPGSYFKQKLFKRQKIAGGTIDRSLRNSNISQGGPGPLDYSVNFNPVVSKTKQIIFGKQERYPHPKKISKASKEISLINQLRMSSNVNYHPLNTKKHDREISKTTLGHY